MLRILGMVAMLALGMAGGVGPLAAHPVQIAGPEAAQGPANATIILLRHAEKPASGPGLAPEGVARADAYAHWFAPFVLDGRALHIDTIAATADSKHSQRPRLTAAPLAQALNLPLQQPCTDAQVAEMADWLRALPPEAAGAGRTILVVWHHGKLPALIGALGADPASLLPGGKWDPQDYDHVIVLTYDGTGRIASARRIAEPATLLADTP